MRILEVLRSRDNGVSFDIRDIRLSGAGSIATILPMPLSLYSIGYSSLLGVAVYLVKPRSASISEKCLSMSACLSVLLKDFRRDEDSSSRSSCSNSLVPSVCIVLLRRLIRISKELKQSNAVTTV